MKTRRLTCTLLVAAAASALAIAGCTSGASGASNATFTSIGYTTQITPGAPMNPFNTTNNIFPSFDAMQLGWSATNPASPNQSLPGLASSWTLSPDGTSLTVHLQRGAAWSNGRAVTADDVKTSAAIWFAMDYVQSYNLGSVTAVNPTTVRFTQAPGSHNNQFEAGVLQQYVVPASVYGHLLPRGIWSTIAASQGSGKAAAAATSSLTALGKTITSFAPKTDISAGPFYIKRLSNSQALLVKNPHFYAASKVHVGDVVMLHYDGAQQIFSYLESGKLDAAPYSAMPTNVYKLVTGAGNTAVKSPSLVAASLAFDEKTYPYNMLAVRQALAYVINRSAVQKVGEPTSGVPSVTTTGAISAALGDYLTPAQRSALNTYPTDPAKAASLLTSAHFTKKGSQWYLPNGKPWKMTIYNVSGFADWIAGANVIESELDSFGVPTSVKLIPTFDTYLANLYKGDYPVGFWLIALGPGAYTTFGRVYGTYDGYLPSGSKLTRYQAGNSTADNFFNTPDTVSVPGLGTVAPGQLTYQLSQLNLNSPAGLAQQKAIAAKLVRTINYEVPVIQLWDYVDVQFVNSRRFTDWPASDSLKDLNPGVWMANGYVHPK